MRILHGFLLNFSKKEVHPMKLSNHNLNLRYYLSVIYHAVVFLFISFNLLNAQNLETGNTKTQKIQSENSKQPNATTKKSTTKKSATKKSTTKKSTTKKHVTKENTSKNIQPKETDNQLKNQVFTMISNLREAFKTSKENDDFKLMSLAVLPFKASETDAQIQEIAFALGELFATNLSGEEGIILVERSRIDDVMKELKKVSQGEISVSGAAKLGKLVGASHVLLGTVVSVGANFQITVRIVDSETGVILKATDGDAPRKDFIAFSKDVVEEKNKSGAMFRSMVIPGWGQNYNQQEIKGWIITGATLLTLGAAATYGIMGMNAEEAYQENKLNTVSQRDQGNQYYSISNRLLMVGGAIWLYGVIDAFIFGRQSNEINLKGWVDSKSSGLIWEQNF